MAYKWVWIRFFVKYQIGFKFWNETSHDKVHCQFREVNFWPKFYLNLCLFHSSYKHNGGKIYFKVRLKRELIYSKFKGNHKGHSSSQIKSPHKFDLITRRTITYFAFQDHSIPNHVSICNAFHDRVMFGTYPGDSFYIIQRKLYK